MAIAVNKASIPTMSARRLQTLNRENMLFPYTYMSPGAGRPVVLYARNSLCKPLMSA